MTSGKPGSGDDQTPDAATESGQAADAPALMSPGELWLERLRVERGYSERTLASYRHALQTLTRFADGVTWPHIREAQVRRWVGLMAREGLAARSIAHRLSAWRGFFEFAREHDRSATNDPVPNPARLVRAPRAPKRLPKALSPDMASHLADFEPEEQFNDLRDKAMLELFYSCGLRLSELRSLDHTYISERDYKSTSWLDTREAQVTVMGKGNKSRTVPVGRAAIVALKPWVRCLKQWRAAHVNADANALFISHRGNRLAARTIQYRLKRLALLRGIPSNVHPHVLRHSFASHILQSSGDLRAVQELLGHASISTTQVYTALDFQRLAKVYDKAHPRARRR